MPELPEVETFVRRLEGSLAQRVIGHIDLRHDYDLKGPFGALKRRLVGNRIRAIRRHGALLFLALERGPHVLVNFGPFGHATLGTDPAELPSQWNLRFELDGGLILSFGWSKPLGFFDVVDDIDGYIAGAGLGPDALAESLDLETFAKRLESRKGPIKQHLCDETFVAGIGPIFSDEILYQARLHPSTPVERLTSLDIKAIYEAMREALAVAVQHEAEPKRYPEWMLTHMRYSNTRINPESGGTFTKEMVAGTVSYFDPELQKSA